MKKISIAITTYNGEKYLSQQLDSLYSQTLLPDEIIVVDDCSTDSTHEILEEYHKNKGLIYIINDNNLGVNKNFEKAITLCSGDYIAICDQDDIWMPTKIEKSVAKLIEIERNGLPTLVTSSNIEIDKNNRLINKPKIKDDHNEYYKSLFGHYMQGCSMFMNRKLIEIIIPLPDKKEIMYDVYIGISASMIGNKYHIGEPLMYHRRHDDNLTGKYNRSNIFRINIKRNYLPFYSEGRLTNMLYVKKRNFKYFIPIRKEIYDSIISVSSEKNIFLKIKKIFNIDVFSTTQKVEAAFYTFFWVLISKK